MLAVNQTNTFYVSLTFYNIKATYILKWEQRRLDNPNEDSGTRYSFNK